MITRDRVLIGLGLLLVLAVCISCNPNPQPEGLTPVPTLAPAATLTLIPSLEGGQETGSETTATQAPEGDAAPISGDPGEGALVFATNCAACHGDDAAGGAVGPTLVSAEVKAKTDEYYLQVISDGIAGTVMPAWGERLSAQNIKDTIAFLRSK